MDDSLDVRKALQEQTLARRNFLKLSLLAGGSAFLAACSSAATASPIASVLSSSRPTQGGAAKFAGQTVTGLMQEAPTPGELYKTVFGPEWKAASGGTLNLNLVDYDTLYQKIILDARNHTAAADIFGEDILWTGQFAVGKIATQLNDRLASNADLSANINPVLLQGVTWKGYLVGLPATNQSWNLFYRADIFQQMGLQPPTTWDDFVRLAQQLNGDWAKDGKKHYGVAFNAIRGTATVHDYMGYFAAMGGQVFDNWPDVTKTTWHPQMNSDAGVKTLTMLQSLVKYAPPDIASYDWNKTQAAINTGLVPMVCSWNDGVNSLTWQPNSPVYQKVTWAALPNVAGIERVDPRGYWSIGINPNSKVQDAAWDYIAYGLSKQAQTELVQKYPGLAPARDDLMQELASDAGPNAFLKFMQKIGQNKNPMNFGWRPTIPEWNNISDIFNVLLNQALIGQLTPKAALDQGNAQLTTVMHQAGYF